MRLAVVDVETTGGMVHRDKIIEIGIAVYDDGSLTQKFESLINPGISIPPIITRITGITNDMVKNAPSFPEIARDVVEMTDGYIFVAHNVEFDYNMLRREFGELGFTYTRKKLCSVRLARQVWPGLKSHGLDNLCRYFDLKIDRRHRALDDALATGKILCNALIEEKGRDLALDIIHHGVRSHHLPEGVELEELHGLPETPGLYYFKNSKGDIAYIGKSKNIKKRVFQHFSKPGERHMRLQQSVRHIEVEETGSELIALLREAEKIKQLRPEMNKAQRSISQPWKLVSVEKDGYKTFKVLKTKQELPENMPIIRKYSRRIHAINHYYHICEEYNLCKCLLLGIRRKATCYHAITGECAGAGFKNESTSSYNDRVDLALEAIETLKIPDGLYRYQEKNGGETHVEVIKGHPIKYCYKGENEIQNNWHTIDNSLQGHEEFRNILRRFLFDENMNHYS